MFISMNWIGDFVDLKGLDLEALIHRFTLSTAEVEDVYHMGEGLKDVVAGKILSMEDIPGSKNHLLKVDAGDQIYDVVCGAPNARPGIIVPFVKEGGMVSGQQIGCAKIGGVESHGMCCSQREVGVSDDHSGLWELPEDTPVGVDLTELYEIKDTVFEVDNKSLTNRPDLWGHYGIAREFAALTGRPLKPLETVELSSYDGLDPIDIQVEDKELCFRYTGLKVRNIRKKVSPMNMRIRLYYCGMRGINLLADLTNYLMLEMGQPMHAFDCAKVGSIEVKRFAQPFTFQTLDGAERKIDENTLMICSQGQPVAVAGIMGGLASEIEDDTDSLLLESACFDAASVRKSSTRLGLRTDASMRYEKTLDPEMTDQAIKRFMKLLLDIDPDVQVISRLTDVYVKRYAPVSLSFDKNYVNRYTGIQISDEQILQTLTSLGFGASYDGTLFHVDVPTWRATKDVTINADIIEEITRIYGYDNFEISTTLSPLYPQKKSAANKCDNFAKDILVQRYGLHEVHSYIWFDAKKCRDLGIEVEDNVKLLSPQSPDLDTLRTNMGPTLLSFLQDNKSYGPEYGIFEIGRVCQGLKDNGECNERKVLGIALYSRVKNEKELYFDLLSMVKELGSAIKREAVSFENSAPIHSWQHPRNTAKAVLGGRAMGWVCTVHPAVLGELDRRASVVCAQIDMDAFAAAKPVDLSYREPSRFPGIDIDLSLLVPDGLRYADLAPAWAGVDPELLTGVTLIDSFDQGGKKSVTLRFAFVSREKTLSKEEVQPVVDDIVSALTAAGAALRS